MAKELLVARVLCDIAHLGLKCGQLVQAEEKLIKSLVSDGTADAHKDAVAYAKSEGAETITIGKDDDDAAADKATLEAEIAELEVKLQAAAEADKAAIQTQIDGKKTTLSAL